MYGSLLFCAHICENRRAGRPKTSETRGYNILYIETEKCVVVVVGLRKETQAHILYNRVHNRGI